jgi:hypothetical protein
LLREKGESIPENWVYEKAENFSKGFMIVGAITGRGVLPLIRVPPKAKVNSEYYIKYVLKRLLEKNCQNYIQESLTKFLSTTTKLPRIHPLKHVNMRLILKLELVFRSLTTL